MIMSSLESKNSIEPLNYLLSILKSLQKVKTEKLIVNSLLLT